MSQIKNKQTNKKHPRHNKHNKAMKKKEITTLFICLLAWFR